MLNMPDEGKARFKAGFLCRKILEMAYQFLSGMEGIFNSLPDAEKETVRQKYNFTKYR